ncbi:cytochrome aa3 quinol oxidase subunit IV [Sutcliffiella cohnii]|uniref:Quinol oxidase subunit 4 n=1 Tax=Sutcliffiella cohnii TaxID=33932 RepID=A0A223KUC7_9BACI|nr:MULTISPECIES: cytochrome aa3 quinol oxidase subunit IV [Sutcliffiella]AST92938.1 cytochrome aa3 quinol oxidase subunit IV [Sutcliffiella cohnii]MED4016098.1 cytochrome aa3 quinol oxidase subunit IV [Sutcliffiella cohnii]WBL14200.1 cytochrome aa3 quinol oxidase subunit IV [Sutcliffiella sp. NC1]
MKELFPLKQVMGFIFSLVLTAVALAVLLFDMSFAVGMTILLVTAFIQAGLQLILFMHAGESNDKASIYTNVLYGIIIAIVTILGTMLTMVWGYV